jgi:hypothetical protein
MLAEMGDRLEETKWRGRFKAEAVDHAWADPFAAEIRDTLERLREPDTVVESVECRTYICFIELEYGSEKALKSSTLSERAFSNFYAPLNKKMGVLGNLYYAKRPRHLTLFNVRRGAPPEYFRDE